MKLSQINFHKSVNNKNIHEGYGRVYDFGYTGDVVNDPKPSALSLGRFISPKNNQLMAGVNLNYLSPEQIKRLRQNLPNILKHKNLRKRARTLRAMMPDIFNSAYRTYKRSEINNVDPKTLKFLDSEPGDVKQPPKPAPDFDPIKPSNINPEKQPEYQEPDKQPQTDKPQTGKLQPDKPKPTLKKPIKPKKPSRPSEKLTDINKDIKTNDQKKQPEDINKPEEETAQPEQQPPKILPKKPGKPRRAGEEELTGSEEPEEEV